VNTTNPKHHLIVNIIGKLALISIPVTLIGSLTWNSYLNEDQAAIIALDANSGKYLWSSELDNDTADQQRLAIDRDRVFVQVGAGPNLASSGRSEYRKYKIVAISADSGRKLWSFTPPGQDGDRIGNMLQVSSPLRVDQNKLWLNTIVSSSPILQAKDDGKETDKIPDRNDIRSGKVINFDARTGKTNWSIDRNLGSESLRNDDIATNDSTTAILKLSPTLDMNIQAYNSSTGKQLWKTLITKFDPKSTAPLFSRYKLVANSENFFVFDALTRKMSSYRWDTGKLISEISLKSKSIKGSYNYLAVDDDATVYRLSISEEKTSNTKITALDPNTGNRRWDLDPDKCSYLKSVVSQPSGLYSLCYFDKNSNGILAVDSKTGREMWFRKYSYSLGSLQNQPGIISNSRTIYTTGFGNNYRNIAIALANTDGKERWKWQPSFRIYGETVAVDDDRFFILAAVPRWRLIFGSIN
jgi:outer membrane protein assembly factor BamB